MKQERVLFLIESPNKKKTLEKFLPKNYIVMPSVGHITKIKDSGLFNMGIDPNNDFKADYVISDDKKDIVKNLKEQVELADKVILASDGDREGELIAFMLKKFLKIKESKYERITFHEITEKAVTEALKHPRKIDMNLVMSAMSRARLDKIVGYRLSPIARKFNVGRSVGRCQSAGLKIIVDREKEIQNFVSEKYYELSLNFSDNDIPYKAKYIGTDDKKINCFKEIEDINKVIKECEGNKFVIKDINISDRKISPKLPFTTSTFQQEVSSKLNISVKKSMEYAQKLFEGININGDHLALITYIRTDSTDLAPEFIPQLKKYIENTYGSNYYKEPTKGKKRENVQDGHEAIRPVDLKMTPDILKNYIDDYNLVKIYKLIFDRTVASYMSQAIIQDTNYFIYNNKNKFQLNLHALKFDGYKKCYNYKEDDDEFALMPKFKIGYQLYDPKLTIEAKETKPPKRFTEASFINTLDKLGIGRPSTYSTIINVLIDKTRNYCYIEDKCLVPTEQGIELSEFLDKDFSDIINTSYTAILETYLDKISCGELNDVEFLNNFYTKLEDSIKKVSPKDVSTNILCPRCGKPLVFRTSRTGNKFLGCSSYPKCTYTQNV